MRRRKCYSHFFLPQYLPEPYQRYQESFSPQVHTCCQQGGRQRARRCVGCGDKLVSEQLAAPLGSDLQLGLHSSTKPAPGERGGVGLQHKISHFCEILGLPCASLLFPYAHIRAGGMGHEGPLSPGKCSCPQQNHVPQRSSFPMKGLGTSAMPSRWVGAGGLGIGGFEHLSSPFWERGAVGAY